MIARRLLAAVAATCSLFGAAAFAAAAPRSTEARRYAVTLEASAAVDRTDAVATELAMTYGGTLLRASSDGAIVIRISPANVRALSADPRVKSVAPLGNRLVAANVVTEPVNWTSGVTYTYDGAGEITKIGADEFLHDDVGRLVQAKINNITRSYDYDAFGNRKDCRQSDGANCMFTFGVTSSDNHMTGVQYDPAGTGNVIRNSPHTYDYDAIDMMTSDNSGATVSEFVYTADDERIATHTTNSGLWQWTVRDLNAKVLREFTSNDSGTAPGAASWKWTRDYVWREQQLLASTQAEVDGNTVYHYHLDHLGTPRRITDQDDNIVAFHDYYAFGPEVFGSLNEQSRTELKYTGHERNSEDEPFALDYMHARFYNPSMGRFLSVDPALKTGAAANSPQLWNRYTYAANSPIKLVDPDGQWASHVYTVHQDAIDTSLPFVGEERRAILRDAQVRIDMDQERQYKHAMRLPGQSVAEARKLTQDYVDRNMAMAIAHELKGNRSMAMEFLGAAIHTLQDATSPMHRGFQMYDPAWGKTSQQWRDHVMGEIRDPGDSFNSGPSLNGVTYAAWVYFASHVGIAVPSNPLELSVSDPKSHSLIEVKE